MNSLFKIALIILTTTLIFTILSTAQAATTTVYFKDSNNAVIKNLDYNQKLSVYYWNKPNVANVMIHGKFNSYSDYYKIKKVKIVFKKKIGKKTVYSTKYFYNEVNYKPLNGYKPYYATIDYLCMVA